jgi:hypothetical protein
MSELNTIELIAPSHWATVFFYGDTSGLEDNEEQAIDAFLEREGVGHCLNCEDYGFVTWHDARREFPYASDCQTYTFELLES